MRAGLRALTAALGLCSAAGSPDAGAADAAWSYSNTAQFRTTHIELTLDIDFDARQLRGGVVLDLERLDPHATQLVLDTLDMDILGVAELTTDIVGGAEKPAPIWISRPFHLGKADPILGSPLVIDVPGFGSDRRVIRVDYLTTPRARGLRWRMPAGSGRRQPPLLYTLSAPINARSWIPLQDTPQVRASYRAHIHAPPGLVALMGAGATPKESRRGDSWFVMTRAVPASAFALVIADLRFKGIGPRIGVYAEGAAATAAAKDSVDAEALLQATEKLLGPYPGGRVDLVVMPAGFPVADLEYPQLVLLSPTLLADDGTRLESLAFALAFECAAGIAGPEWRDRWLAESIAGYVAQRTIADVHGAQLSDLPIGRAVDGVLAADLQGLGYDDMFSAVQRDKGTLLFSWLEARVGRARFDPWLRELAVRFAQQGATTTEFLAFLQESLLSGAAGLPTQAEVIAWLFDASLPRDADAAPPRPPALADVAVLTSGDIKALALQTRHWPPTHWARVLDGVADNIEAARLAELDRAFALSASRNADIAAAWFALTLRASYEPGLRPLEDYLLTTGRLSLLEPLYEQLAQTEQGAGIARRIFTRARPHYDPFVARRLEEIVRP